MDTLFEEVTEQIAPDLGIMPPIIPSTSTTTAISSTTPAVSSSSSVSSTSSSNVNYVSSATLSSDPSESAHTYRGIKE
jgi:hypothetical protein